MEQKLRDSAVLFELFYFLFQHFAVVGVHCNVFPNSKCGVCTCLRCILLIDQQLFEIADAALKELEILFAVNIEVYAPAFTLAVRHLSEDPAVR